MYKPAILSLGSFSLTVLFVLSVMSPVLALEDPTRPSSYTYTSEENVQYHLSSVFWGEVRKVAIINGQVLTEGDYIGSAKVVEIEKQRVRIDDGGVMIDLTPPSPSVKQEIY